MDAFDLHEPAGLLDAEQRLERGVGDHELDRPPEHAARGIEMLDRELEAEPHLLAKLGEAASEVDQQADLHRRVRGHRLRSRLLGRLLDRLLHGLLHGLLRPSAAERRRATRYRLS